MCLYLFSIVDYTHLTQNTSSIYAYQYKYKTSVNIEQFTLRIIFCNPSKQFSEKHNPSAQPLATDVQYWPRPRTQVSYFNLQEE